MNEEFRQQQDPDDSEAGVIQAEIVEDGPEEGHDNAVSPEEVLQKQGEELEEFAAEFLKKVLRLRGVQIDRAQFLTSELHKRGIAREDIEAAVSSSPAAAGISPAMLDEIAASSIGFETRKSTALSFAAGLPGGFAMLGSVPADITQFYIHAFRVMQKIAYVYGWQSFLKDMNDIDDETLAKLAAFLGVMMGIGGASSSVTSFAAQVARPAIQKKITNAALTKTVWYGPMKSTLRMVGVNVTKQSFAKGVTKVVPVAGGVISGGLTFVTLDSQSKRLMKHLREIPPPNVDAAAYMHAVRLAEEEDPGKVRAVGATFEDAIGRIRPPRPSTEETGERSAVEKTARGAASAFRGVVDGAADRLRSATRNEESAETADEAGSPEAGTAIRGAAAGAAGRLGSFMNRRKDRKGAEPDSNRQENSDDPPGAD